MVSFPQSMSGARLGFPATAPRLKETGGNLANGFFDLLPGTTRKFLLHTNGIT